MIESEALKEMHEETTGQPRELFFKQMIHFRKIMCSTAYTLEYKEKAFEHLAESYFRCNLTEDDKSLFVSVADEFQMRSGYELFRNRKLGRPKNG